MVQQGLQDARDRMLASRIRKIRERRDFYHAESERLLERVRTLLESCHVDVKSQSDEVG
jgi:hypothetical protein